MASDAPVEGECSDRTMFLILYGFYMAWMMGIAVIAYNKLHGSNDYATHFVGRKDYGVIVMTLTIFASDGSFTSSPEAMWRDVAYRAGGIMRQPGGYLSTRPRCCGGGGWRPSIIVR